MVPKTFSLANGRRWMPDLLSVSPSLRFINPSLFPIKFCQHDIFYLFLSLPLSEYSSSYRIRYFIFSTDMSSIISSISLSSFVSLSLYLSHSPFLYLSLSLTLSLTLCPFSSVFFFIILTLFLFLIFGGQICLHATRCPPHHALLFRSEHISQSC